MYNGIGLTTARGSGTNGFVQRNFALVRHRKDKVDYRTEEDIAKLDAMQHRKANPELLSHERKRRVELKCIEMEELMEEQGYSRDEIERKVSAFRKMLMEKEGVTDSPMTDIEKDEAGRPITKDSHQVAAAKDARNQILKAAFGISDYFQDGSSLDSDRKAKEDQMRSEEIAKRKYVIVKESDDDKAASVSPERKKKKKKKRSQSESPSPSHKDKKKSKKQSKRDRFAQIS